MDCTKCSIEMQKLCATYPASYNCKPEAVAYRKEMKDNSGLTDKDFLYEDK